MFFDRYVISNSPANAHCLLHSIVKSVPNQVGVNVSMVDLVKNIEAETVHNKDKYTVVYENRSYEIIFEEMLAYTQSKIYKSSHDDLTPIIVANVLEINIRIVSYINEPLVIEIIPTDFLENVKTVYV